MKQINIILMLVSIILGLQLGYSQETFPRNDVLDNREDAFAFIHATIITDPETKLENATLIIKNGKIENVGPGIPIPKGYTTIDLKGKYIYPSFIDLNTNYGIPEQERQRRGGGFGAAEQIQSATRGAYNANEAIKAQYNASEEFAIDSKSAGAMRKNGFGTVLTYKSDGISRGTSALVTLGEESVNGSLLMNQAAAHYSLTKGSSQQNYPGSMMGFIALLRQTYLDAEWFSSQSPRPFADQTLEAWINSQKLPQVFDAGNWLNVLRADKIGDEFGVKYIITSGGDDYQRINDIKSTKSSLIVPVNFPDAYDVDDPIDAEKVSYADMKHWELAPTNPGVLEKNGIIFSITSAGAGDDFLTNIRTAIHYGLSENAALKALTTVPAMLLNAQNSVGKIKSGMVANFLITSDEIFKDKMIIHENWVQGKPYKLKPLNTHDYSGVYSLNIGGTVYQLEISGEPGSQKSKVILDDSTSIDAKSKFDNDLLTLGIKLQKDAKEEIRLSGWKTANGWKGTGQEVNGDWVNWEASRDGDVKANDKGKRGDKEAKENTDLVGNTIFPFVAFGRKELPKQENILIKNATVWTNEADGILTNTDVLLKDGKIAQIGKSINADGTLTIDGSGKHLTSGIIDEHTHIGGGGNDRATNSSMVRIGDQLNSEQISIYRTLAGGVTAAQVLHGSANPVGGQSALIKLRWGESPENLKIKGADEFIKFALGENVKRSSSNQSIRYPQSRMGVEQVYMDGFSNALEYEKAWKNYNTLNATTKATAIKPRRDLVDEAMLEIINGKRFITCHSYVQSEINMLMELAESFNFRVNTFTHILEGYKVADKMKEHGAAASTFSDWWNYKWEVRYAIPYNAAILQREGVLTAINSDDANMGRRLNQEAAKTIKYGNISEEDAWKMVTLNPAKMLHLDKQMGSVKVGKDADVVLWTDHPLSVYARAEKTIIDGKIYFDIIEDQKLRDEMRMERARIIQKMKDSKKKGGKMQRPNSESHFDFHCDDDYDLGNFINQKN